MELDVLYSDIGSANTDPRSDVLPQLGPVTAAMQYGPGAPFCPPVNRDIP